MLSKFSCTFWPFVHLWRNVYYIFCPFNDWVIWFLYIKLYEQCVLYILEINLLLVTSFANIFFRAPRSLFIFFLKFLLLCCYSVTKSYLPLCDPMDCSTPGFPVLHHLPEFARTHVYWVADAIQASHLLPSPSPPAFSVFQDQSLSQWLALCIRWPKYWSFNFRISPSTEYSGLISFRIDWFDLPALQGTLKTPLQHHNLKASVLWHSAFLMVEL